MGLRDAASDLLEQQIEELRSILANLQGLDLWPPWDAAQTLVDLVSQAYAVATQPPEPDPVHLRDAAEEWRLIATTVGRAREDLVTARSTASPDVWEGDAGAAFRSSVQVFTSKVATVPVAADGVALALESMATEMDDSRKRHGDAWDGLRDHLSISWSDALPWELVDKLRGILGEVVAAVQDLVGAYEDAGAAGEVCRSAVRAAMDEIELPDHLPPGVPSVVDLVNQWLDDRGPLQGSVLERYGDALDAMSPADRAALMELLEGASPEERAWIMAAVAAGLSGAALTRYAKRLGEIDLAALDPGAFPDGTRTQPDETTCGSSSLVMAKMENDPAFAMWILTGYDPVTGETDSGTPESRFDQAAQEMHDRTNGLHDRDGDLQVPWPGGLGTQPWALAAEMSAEGGSGVPGTSYGVDAVDPHHPGRSFDAIVAASEDGHTVPFYVGDGTHPGHVALVTGASGDTLTVYEPYHGQTITVSRDDWVNGTLDVAGWEKPWLVVVPES